jgi:hypothetical protein
MHTPLQTIGRAEKLGFPELGLANISARIDTGARMSAIWASSIREEDGVLYFVLFDTQSTYYSGKVLHTQQYGLRTVTSSMGHSEERYVVKFLVTLEDKKIRASFTLANRSKQVYPVLVGRNILRGKFMVNVKLATSRNSTLKQKDAS